MPDAKDTWAKLNIGECDFCACDTNHDEFGKCERCQR